ncbi:MAG: peptidoglycan DD-metalloendopeptidase family protein [Deltaproteobacteria bacterium]|nr:peptidoglycan DD-metalloendopeptidase family protein [Deltaproteobacteria bacterium]
MNHAQGNKSQARHIEKQLLKQQGRLKDVNIKEKNILEELESLEKSTTKNRRSLKKLSEEIETLSAKITEAQARIKELNASTREVKNVFETRLVAFYKYGKSSYLTLLISNEDLYGIRKKIKYIKAIISHDREIMANLSEKKKELENEIELLHKDKSRIETLKEAKKKSADLLEKDIEKKVLLLVKAHKEKEFYEKAIKELKDASNRLNKKILGLGEKEEKTSLKTFEEMKGKLPMPLMGKILNYSATQNREPFIHRKGIYIKGAFGDTIQSIFPGKVVFSDWFKGYGQMIIINHGSRYFTMFAHLGDIKKEVGEMVSEGEILGNAGDTGLNLGPGLYFEIRRGGICLDPKKWLKLH